ncbi:hypothetical protein [Rhizobium wenxiniae]|uniref:hypothetical protein n=1 Tax=Rhizobium wenxiniae TaxID=1737357 RepID=UPI003C130A1F
MRFSALTAMFAATVLNTASAASIDSVVTETIDFKTPDSQATTTARQMYGREFRTVAAQRVWLEEPDKDFEQLAVLLGKERNCASGCFIATLYYDETQWLEVWRRPGKAIGLGPVGLTGMKPLFDGTRLWKWSGTNYLAQPLHQEIKPRPPSEAELQTATEAIKAEYRGGIEPLEPATVSAVDVNVKTGKEVALLLTSTYYCGNSTCPIIFLDEAGKSIGLLRALGPDFAITRDYDANGRRLVEVSVYGGVETYSLGESKPRSKIGPMDISVAGTKR